MSYATPAEIEALLGRTFTAEETTKATAILEIVDVAIDAYLNGRTATAATVTIVAKLAGRRLFLDPVGIRQESLGDWSATYSAERLLSDDEKHLLDFAVDDTAGTRRRRTGSPRTPSDLWEYELETPTP